MGELRSAKIMVSVEDSLYQLLVTLLEREDWSASSYFRGLMISDLRERGIIDEEFLARILSFPRTARSASARTSVS